MITDPTFAPWRDSAIARGFRSSIVFPLKSEQRIFGAITIYSTEPDPFSESEIAFLSELANDLSHGITAIRLRAELDKTVSLLRDERYFSNGVIETTGGLIAGFDQNGCIRIFNSACEKTTGYSYQEVRDKPFWDFLLVPEEVSMVREVFEGIRHGTVTPEMEYESFWVARDGTRRYIRWANAALRDEHGNVTLVIGTGIDISERQAMEELLRVKAAELTDANQELEAFTYSVAHDLRNPLHSIVGCVDVLKSSVSEQDSDGKEAIGHIERSVTRMSDVISDLLVLSRIARQDVNRKRIDLTAMAVSAFSEIRSSAPQRVADFSAAEGLITEADPGLVHIVLENLLRNAWKFTSKKDRALIEFAAREESGKQVFYVRDNGAGFDMAHAQRLFRPFVRLHSELEFRGTGIGLATVKRIVDKHGGHVRAESEKDKGTCIFFRLN
jgi:PAS domain S-box-containing protein